MTIGWFSAQILLNVSIAAIITIALFALLKLGSQKRKPNVYQMFFERFHGEVDKLGNSFVTQNKADKIVPIIMVSMVFIVVANLMGLVQIPLVQDSAGNVVLYLGTPNSAFTVTFGYSLVVAALSIYYTVKYKGWKGAMSLLLIMPLFTIFMNSATLGIRLFANMLSGEIQSIVFGSFMTGGPWSSLGNFIGSTVLALLGVMTVMVAVIQGYVFGVLSMLYLAQAAGMKTEDEEREHEVSEQKNAIRLQNYDVLIKNLEKEN